MTIKFNIECNILNVKFSNSQLRKLKSVIKNGTKVTLNLSSNVAGNSNYENIFTWLLTNTKVSKIRKSFVNGLSANAKFLKTQLSKMMQLGRYIYSNHGKWKMLYHWNLYFNSKLICKRIKKNRSYKIKE